MNEQRLARALAWFSIGLGAAQLLAPRRVSRLIGAGDYPILMRLLGLRELASGIGMLTQQRRAPWAGARIAGDVMDLALLGTAMQSDGTRRNRLAATTAAVAGVTALDVAVTASLAKREGSQPAPVRESVAVKRGPEELYAFWRDLPNLPRFMTNLVSVTEQEGRRSCWVAKGPGGKTISWYSEITEDRPGEMIAWRSLPESDVRHTGRVHFDKAPGEHGTYVRVEIEYAPPGGVLGAGLARALGKAPEHMVREDLRRFRQLMEAGEIPTTAGQPSGRPQAGGKGTR